MSVCACIVVSVGVAMEAALVTAGVVVGEDAAGVGEGSVASCVGAGGVVAGW
jgi:hypothetical protein